MAEIANAIHVHIMDGTMDVDSINASLRPTAHMTLIIHAVNPTPATNPPQNTASIDEQGRDTVYSGDSTPDLATRVAAASQMPGIDPAPQLNDAQEGSGSSSLGTRGPETQNSRSSGDGTRSAMDITGKQTAYPVSLASQNPRKRKPSLRRNAPKKAPKLTETGTDIQKEPEREVEAGSEGADEDNQRNRDIVSEEAKKALLQKWLHKMPWLSSWKGLENHACIGDSSNQKPYGAVDDILERIQEIGTLEVQKAFVQCVHSWVAAKLTEFSDLQHPDHLNNVDGYDAKPFQTIWRTLCIPDVTKGSGDMGALLNRKAVIDRMEAYHDILLEVQKKIKEGKLSMAPQEPSSSKARQIIFETLYDNTSEREKKLRLFNYTRKESGKLFRELVQHYGSKGILAMIPATLAETRLRGGDRIAMIIDILDLMRPDLRNQRLELYSKVLDMISDGNDPDGETLAELDNSWIGD